MQLIETLGNVNSGGHCTLCYEHYKRTEGKKTLLEDSNSVVEIYNVCGECHEKLREKTNPKNRV